MPPPDSETSRWFAQEVHPHEGALRSYLRARFPSIEADDVVQESYLKLLKARALGRIDSSRAYFFSVARNTALTLFRRRKLYSDVPVADLPEARMVDDRQNVVETAHANQRVELVIAAIDELPARCRAVLQLAAIERKSVPEIASRLGISEATVYVQMARGIRKCARFISDRGERP